MEEEKKNPQDLNGDGKVTWAEKLQYAAGKANEKISEAAVNLKKDAKDLYEKASPKVKEVCAEVKENATEFAGKAKVKLDEMSEDVSEAADRAKAKFQERKEKKEN